jgi:hypothetical protein
MASDQVHLKV